MSSETERAASRTVVASVAKAAGPQRVLRARCAGRCLSRTGRCARVAKRGVVGGGVWWPYRCMRPPPGPTRRGAAPRAGGEGEEPRRFAGACLSVQRRCALLYGAVLSSTARAALRCAARRCCTVRCDAAVSVPVVRYAERHRVWSYRTVVRIPAVCTADRTPLHHSCCRRIPRNVLEAGAWRFVGSGGVDDDARDAWGLTFSHRGRFPTGGC